MKTRPSLSLAISAFNNLRESFHVDLSSAEDRARVESQDVEAFYHQAFERAAEKTAGVDEKVLTLARNYYFHLVSSCADFSTAAMQVLGDETLGNQATDIMLGHFNDDLIRKMRVDKNYKAFAETGDIPSFDPNKDMKKFKKMEISPSLALVLVSLMEKAYGIHVSIWVASVLGKTVEEVKGNVTHDEATVEFMFPTLH